MKEAGRLLCVGIRGAEPGDPVLEADLEACRVAGVGGIILFDVDVPAWRRLQDEGLNAEEARVRAVRNIISPSQLGSLTARVREVLGPDIFIAIDQEGGRVARLTAARGFADDPSATAFAALEPTDRQAAATSQARQLATGGIDLNFAPCVDLALEPDNPIITRLDRAYGADAGTVTACARLVLEAHRLAGVASCLKHFPGHGSTRTDTHRGGADITDTWQRDRELSPYRDLVGEPGMAVMVAHVLHRGLDPDRPASLSPAITGDLLRGEMGFTGVIITDSIDMRAISDRWTPQEAAVMAVAAGADLVVDGFNLDERQEHPAPALTAALATAFGNGSIPGGRARLQESLSRLERLRAEIGADA